jgi:Fungal chitosanase of glycosyl hydrolase group 75
MKTKIETVEGHDVFLEDDGRITYTAKAAIDADGSGPSLRDPDFQGDTSRHFEHRALDATKVPYVVVPPSIIDAVAPIVLGCQARVSFQGKTTEAVVGDIGPRHKLGELSVACAKALDIPASPISGGVDEGVHYEIIPGQRLW